MNAHERSKLLFKTRAGLIRIQIKKLAICFALAAWPAVVKYNLRFFLIDIASGIFFTLVGAVLLRAFYVMFAYTEASPDVYARLVPYFMLAFFWMALDTAFERLAYWGDKWWPRKPGPRPWDKQPW